MPYHVVHHDYEIELPEDPFDLWCKDELWKYIGVEKGAKIEVIGGEIRVQGAPMSSGIGSDVHPLQQIRDMEARMEKMIVELSTRRAVDE
ncbi:hypothetical protein [Actinomadura sp. WMMB 499]|uniref:hypothetical protein n=1 Tax=Actinomadura sp. WMMB 499 TaxID=1219491 RepID=UPI001245053E|nr:hypothetical protein [Actinomadura sp. WMMB 499]QFG25095.1 hypothetical protein F7P10_32110 [Actinomadura sp. WMMB 499]